MHSALRLRRRFGEDRGLVDPTGRRTPDRLRVGCASSMEVSASQTWVRAGESEEHDLSTNEFRRDSNLLTWTMLYCCVILDTYPCTRWDLSLDWLFST